MKWFDLPPLWLLGFAVVTWLSRGILTAGAAPLRVLGTVLVVAGVAIIIAAVVEMARRKTTVIPHLEPDALVTSGVFGLSRNPIYLADAVILAGLSLRWDAPLGLLLVPVFMALIARRFIRAEEARLTRAFGQDFTGYALRTRRWL